MLKRSLGLQVTNLSRYCLQSAESYKLSTEADAPASCQMVEERKRNRTWPNYDDFLYRIIEKIFINLIFVKFVDSSP